MQNKEHLEKLLQGVVKARDALDKSPVTGSKPKIMLKIAPDLEEAQLVDMANVIRECNIDGVIVSNTTIQRPKSLVNGTSPPNKIADADILSANKTETGGLSGPPIKPLSIKALTTLRSRLPASIPLIGCGGISTGKDALDFAKAGASLVQVYTSFSYDGVGAPRRIKDQLAEELAKEGKSWAQVVRESVNTHAWTEAKGAEEEKQKREAAIKVLISEAQELTTMLDKLGERLESQ